MRRQYAGAAFASVLTADLAASAGATTISCNNLTNWPNGSIGPFYVVIDRGLATEEKILCVSRASNTLTVYDDGITNGRGADGTAISAHSTNAVIEHVFTATDADEANAHVNDPSIHGAGAKGGGNDHVFWQNDQTVTTSYTITAAQNAMSAGPITINSGATVTVPSGTTWTVI